MRSNYLVTLGIATGALLLALPAHAQTVEESSIDYVVTAEVEAVCTISLPGGASSQSIEFDEDLSGVSTLDTVSVNGLSAIYTCNSPQGLTRTVTSLNNGFLFREGTSGGERNQIAYEFVIQPRFGLGLTRRQLTTPQVQTNNNDRLLGGAQSSTTTFFVNGVQDGAGTTVFAGDYSDVVTIGVVAN